MILTALLLDENKPCETDGDANNKHFSAAVVEHTIIRNRQPVGTGFSCECIF